MKNLFIQTFADLKSGDIFRYLSESAQNFVKKAQLAAGTKVYTEDYKTLQGDIQRSEKALDKLKEKQRDMGAAGTSQESTEWQKVAAQIATAQARLDSYNSKKREMESSGADVQFTGGLANQSALKNMGAVAGEALSSLQQRLGEIPGAVSQAIGNIPIIGRVAKEAAYIGEAAFNGLKLAMSGIASTASSVISFFSKVGAAAKSLASKVRSAMSSFLGLGKSSKGLNVSLAGGFKTLLKYGLGIRSVYTLINKLRRAIVDGFKNLATYSNEVNNSLSMLKSSLNTFKNASAAALSPLLNAIAPALNTIIQLCIKATNAINQLLSALFGKGTWIHAKDQVLDFASGVKSAAKEAQKGVRVFDELKVINTNDDSGDSSGTNPADMFETLPIDEKFLDWAEKLKAMWKNADFTELGSAIGDWLKNALDNIDWDGIKGKAAKLGSSLATLINGFIETDDLGYSIGFTLAQGINTGFEFLNEFVHNLHWDSLGKFIAEALNGLFQNLDWDLITDTFFAGAKGLADAINSFDEFLDWGAISTTISNAFNTLVGTIRIFVGNVDWKALGGDIGKTISDAWMGIDWAEVGATVGESFIAFFDFISSAIENVDWQGVAQTVEDFVTGIDWGGVADSFFEAVGAAFGGLSAVLGKLLYDAIDGTKKYFQGKIEEVGGNIPKGILKGIWEGVKNIGIWIYEHIFKPFIDGFKKAFGIASPSKVMEEQGGFIMQGLLGGISSLVQSVIDIFNKIKEKIVEVWDAIKTKTSEVWNGIKTFVSGLWTGLKTNVSNVFGSIKTTITNIWNGIKTVTVNVWNGIKNAIKTPINAIIGFINGLVSGVVGGMNGMINAMNKLSFDVPDWVPAIGGETFGFNIPNITAPQIPYLATGAVFKGGNPYMAIVNDQPRGQTNIEAPLKTIKQALREELGNFDANIQLASFPNIGTYQMAPAPTFDDMYNYRQASNFTTEYNDAGISDGVGLNEEQVYNIVYNAISAAMTNNTLLRSQNEILEDIRDKPSMGIGELGRELAKDSWNRGGNTGKGGMRLAVAQELY